MKKVMKIVVVLMMVGLPLIFWKELKGAFSATGKDKIEKRNSNTDDKNHPVASVTVLDRWQLPAILTEVSGIEYLGEGRFACIQDEMGTIFIYNTASGKIEKQISFAGAGDYEGIAVAGNTAYVVQSDGRVYEVRDYQSGKPAVKQYTTPLTAKHNVEGLTYDEKNNRLLLAIKGAEPNNNDYKGVYAFDVKSYQMEATPVVKINLSDPIFNGIQEKKRKNILQPSEIEVHPQTNDIYILEGANPKLLVMDAKGNKKKLYEMQKTEFPQPEGLAFSPQGEIFISNEGNGGTATILKVAFE